MAKPADDEPDEMLVVAAILGDFDAFDELASRYRKAVVRAAQVIVGREDAEDVAQGCVVACLQSSAVDRGPVQVRCMAVGHHSASRASLHKTGTRLELKASRDG